MADAIESFHLRLRNEGFTNGSICCRFPDLPPMVGYAFTVKVRGASPPVGGRPFLERTDWWETLLAVPEPRVLVVEDVITTGGQVAMSTEDLRGLGAIVDTVLCVIDRSGGRHEALDAAGLTVSSLFTSAELDAAGEVTADGT